MAPEFEKVEEMWDVVDWDAVRESEGLSPIASDEDDAETWAISDKDETLGLSVTVDVCAYVVDIADTLVAAEEPKVEDERWGVFLRIAILDVEA